MPIRVRKTGRGYRVTNAGRVTAKNTTRAKAKRQARLLRAVKHGFRPSRRA